MAPKSGSLFRLPEGDSLVVVRRSLVRLFDGDHGCATVLSVFDYLTRCQENLIDAREIDDEPWIEASIAKIQEQGVDLYGRTKIIACIELFQALGFLRVEKTGLGSISRYLLDYRKVSELLDRRAVINPKNPESEIGLENQPSSPPPSPKSDSNLSAAESEIGLETGVYIGKENRVLEREEESSSPSPSLVDYHTAKRILEQTKGITVRRPQRKLLEEAAPFDCTEKQFEEMARRLVEWCTQKSKPDPVAVFLGNPHQWIGADEPRRTTRTAPTPQSPEPQPAAQTTAVILAPPPPLEWKDDRTFQLYLMALGKTGKRIDPKKAKTAYEQFWPKFDEDRQRAAIEDAEYLANQRRDRPEMIPNPESHLEGAPWDVLRRRDVPEESSNEKSAKRQRLLAALNKRIAERNQ